uniref:dihydrofolate reductase n=1 Tax=Myripristis murdjan TaxID=586833 RepID=A0A667XG03_9TELE
NFTLEGKKMKPVRLIAAACNNLGIGKDGQLPWLWSYLRLCWYSCPHCLFPMKNTLHAVLSKTLSAAPDHAHFLCRDFESSVPLAALPPLADVIETIWVVGGSRVYEEGLKHPWCDLVYLTDIMADFDCDVFFPQFDRKVFKIQDRFPGVPSEIQEENGIKYKFQVFKREICDEEKETN